MNPFTVLSTIFGIGVAAGGSAGGYFVYLNYHQEIAKKLEYSTYRHIPKKDHKYFPFANKGQPEKYDKYFLIDRTSLPSVMGFGKKDIEKDNDGNFKCLLHILQSLPQIAEGEICQIFEIIKKDTDSDKDAIKCPEKIEDLKPISFKNFGTEEYKQNFPNIFLLAIKYRNAKSQSDLFLILDLLNGDDEKENKNGLLHFSFIGRENDMHECNELSK